MAHIKEYSFVAVEDYYRKPQPVKTQRTTNCGVPRSSSYTNNTTHTPMVQKHLTRGSAEDVRVRGPGSLFQDYVLPHP